MPKTYKVEVSFLIGQEGDYYVAYCPALDLSAYAKTEAGAKKSFAEVLKIFIADTTQKGTLEKVLLSHGWKLQQKPSFKYEPPALPARARSARVEKRMIPISTAA